MKKTWFNRLLLSYVPVIFITTTIIIFISVSIISEISIKETEKANRIFNSYVIDSMDTSLHGVERVILEKISNNDNFHAFFEPSSFDDQNLVNYKVSTEIDNIIRENPLIYTIYLYRQKDQIVISRSLISKLDDFEDKGFIQQAYNKPQLFRWYPVRDYKEFRQDLSDKVLTLSKEAMLPFGNQGIVVVNVRVKSLVGIVDEMLNKDITFMDIWSENHTKVYPMESITTEGITNSKESQGKIISQVHSDYIGWDFVSGLKAGKFFGWVSFISRIWLGFGIATILFSFFYIFYVTRRNYKPIEIIMDQIHMFQSRNETKGSGSDEFSFIGKVLGNLIDQTQVYEKQYQEDLLHRRKQFFLELIEGENKIAMEEWRMYMNRFNLQTEFKHLALAVIEIDGYSEFQNIYNQHDQNLLKFGLTNVISEFSVNDRQSAWLEWLSGQRLALVFIANEFEAADDVNQQTINILEKFRTWVMVNLKISTTSGFGGSVRELSGVRKVYDASILALDYKMALGNGRVISLEDLQTSNDTNKFVQMMNAMVQDFRLTNQAWEAILEQFFQQLAQEVFKNDEIHYVLNYLIRLFNREMEEITPEVARLWKERVHPALLLALEASETLDAIGPVFISMLRELYEKYIFVRESNSHHGLINKIRIYIEKNYANPDLSLNHISDRFAVNGKYASQLFKEEFGMKFVDFLVNLRMERAKALLLQTDETINDISTQVGYIHAISFGRTFKKAVGVTPGDFRKYMNV